LLNLTTVKRRRWAAGIVAVAALLVAGASSCDTGQQRSNEQTARNAVEDQQAAIMKGVERRNTSQQIPVFDWSQEFQTLLDVLTMRAEGTHGTAYAKALDGSLLWWCPTVGAPVPSTYQVTPGEAYVDIKGDGIEAKFPVDLPEPTGAHIGDSAATWTVCLDDAGTSFGVYEEANVGWRSGVVDGLPRDLRARVDEVTFNFTPPPEG